MHFLLLKYSGEDPDQPVVDSVGNGQGKNGAAGDFLPTQAEERANEAGHENLAEIEPCEMIKAEDQGGDENRRCIRQEDFLQLMIQKTTEDEFFHQTDTEDEIKQLSDGFSGGGIGYTGVDHFFQSQAHGKKRQNRGHSKTNQDTKEYLFRKIR